MDARKNAKSLTSRRLGYLFKHAERLMADLHIEALAPYDINARDLGVLLAIDRSESASQQQIAENLGVDRTTMVAIIDTLETKGIIARRPDPEDRRRNIVELTQPGQTLLRQATAASDLAEAELLAPLNRQEGEQLRTLLARILDRD
ncbi:MAG: MarR family winged helix-turn-helix transcriptional regulator [Acidimicrobiales bacterium]